MSQPVGKVCVSLDPTMEAVKTSIRQRAQLLLTHHPLIFKPLTHLDIYSYPASVILEAARENISIVALHTNLDMAERGMNHMLAEELQLCRVGVLKETGERTGSGLGRIGELPSPIPLSSFVDQVKEILGASRLRLVGNPEKPIRRVAVVGGAGGGLVREAFEKHADLLLTGDVGHHHALEARMLGLALVDGGHFLTERVGLRRFTGVFADALKKQGWDVQVAFLQEEEDPMNWA